MTTQKPDLQTIAREADDAFWQVVVRQYPEATSGDLSPLTTLHLHEAQETAIEEWIWADVPRQDAEGDDDADY